MQESSDVPLDFAQFAQFPHGLQTNAGLRCCSLFSVVLAFFNYRPITHMALDNREIREHPRTENNVEDSRGRRVASKSAILPERTYRARHDASRRDSCGLGRAEIALTSRQRRATLRSGTGRADDSYCTADVAGCVWRRGGMAARGAGAARRADAAHRHLNAVSSDRRRISRPR